MRCGGEACSHARLCTNKYQSCGHLLKWHGSMSDHLYTQYDTELMHFIRLHDTRHLSPDFWHINMYVYVHI